MPDLTIELVIPEAWIPRMKAAIEWNVATGRVPSPDGVEVDENGGLTNQEALVMFKRMTIMQWRSIVSYYQKNQQDLDPGFDPDLVP